MNTAWRLTCALAAFGLTSCGGSGAPPPKADPKVPVDGVGNPVAAPAAEGIEEWLAGQRAAAEATLSGQGVSETSAADARALALRALEAAFWGESEWPSLPPPIETERPSLFGAVEIAEIERDGQFAAFVRTELEPIPGVAERWLGTLADRSPEPGDGFREALDAVLYRAWSRTAQARICERLVQFGLAESCELLSLSEQEATLQRLADGLVLESVYADGIPVDLSGKPARPLEILATWTDGSSDPMPVSGVPIRVDQGASWFVLPSPPAEDDSAAAGESADSAPPTATRTTGEAGVARFEFVQAPSDPSERLGVALDRDALLGSFADSFPELVLSVPFRRVTPDDARIALAVRERWQDAETTHLVSALREGLAKTREATLLDEETTALLEEEITPERLDEIAVLTRGRVDVLITGEATSQLTSRMGSRSVYHEASATLIVYDLWSGARVATLEDRVQALGLGEARAAKNALDQLGEALVEKINSALKRPVAAR